MENKYMDAVDYFVENNGEFLWQVLTPIFIWLILVLIFIILLFQRFTFSNRWTKDNPNPYKDETFGMPRGTFRGILTMSLLYVAIILELVNVRIIGFEEEVKEFMIAFQMMIAFYFGSKVMHHVTSSDQKKTIAATGTSTTNNTTSTTQETVASDEDAMG